MSDTKIGILMLDTQFYRPPGDIGNQDTFPFPVRYKTVKGASITRVVKEGGADVVEPFVQAAKELEKEGMKAVATSCGFLAIHQKKIQKRLDIPFYSSSLLQIPMASITAGEPIGILTASEANLKPLHFKGANAGRYNVIIKGMDDKPAFSGTIIEETVPLNQTAVQSEMEMATAELLENHPEVKSIILECTNMPPYKEAIRGITDLPIFDSTTLIHYIHSSI